MVLWWNWPHVQSCLTWFCNRSLSEFQETAQYLSGLAFPEAIMTALLGKTKLPSKLLGIVNCTPYDCWVERACMQPLGTNLVILLNKTIFQVSRIYKK